MSGREDLPILYYKQGCSGCTVARRWLAEHNLKVREREIFRQPLSTAEIEGIAGDRPIADVLSTRTKQYTARGLNTRAHSEAELLRHMEAEPRLLRRPILKHGDLLLIGFDAPTWEAALRDLIQTQAA